MPVRTILRFPDPRLRQTSKPVIAFDATLRQLVSDMKDTMYLAEGAGLAAIQIGEALRLFIVDPEVAGAGDDAPRSCSPIPSWCGSPRKNRPGTRAAYRSLASSFR